MWHASVSAPTGIRRRLARKALRGVGDLTAEWEDLRQVAYHVRRRLTPAEAGCVGGVRDLRGTAEGRERWERLKHAVPSQVWRMALEEIGT